QNELASDGRTPRKKCHEKNVPRTVRQPGLRTSASTTAASTTRVEVAEIAIERRARARRASWRSARLVGIAFTTALFQHGNARARLHPAGGDRLQLSVRAQLRQCLIDAAGQLRVLRQ